MSFCLALFFYQNLNLPEESVPLPNSSMMIRLRLVAKLMAEDICWRSIMKALCALDTVSMVAILVRILSVRPMTALSAGTKHPTCAM